MGEPLVLPVKFRHAIAVEVFDGCDAAVAQREMVVELDTVGPLTEHQVLEATMGAAGEVEHYDVLNAIRIEIRGELHAPVLDLGDLRVNRGHRIRIAQAIVQHYLDLSLALEPRDGPLRRLGLLSWLRRWRRWPRGRRPSYHSGSWCRGLRRSGGRPRRCRRRRSRGRRRWTRGSGLPFLPLPRGEHRRDRYRRYAQTEPSAHDRPPFAL